MTIPDSLLDSAKIDGASEVTILWKIVVPLSVPVIATVLLWNLVGNWNSWVGCMIYITDAKKQVLQIILRDIFKRANYNLMSQNPYENIETAKKAISNEGLKATTWVFVTLPILVSYPYFQKYFVKGIMIGSLKG
jgi:putative aldouronate transport system permease protein